MTMTQRSEVATAEVVTHRYSTGKRFFLVECHACNTVLNSGHHYRPQDEALAQDLANRHNTAEHSEVEATPAHLVAAGDTVRVYLRLATYLGRPELLGSDLPVESVETDGNLVGIQLLGLPMVWNTADAAIPVVADDTDGAPFQPGTSTREAN